ncbi:DUF2848 domain-containing protein [Microbacteriaceae bacterium K1510]|nr:DUF2848 domain-containing protein [Microbacteriaceae bacterium K1510]
MTGRKLSLTFATSAGTTHGNVAITTCVVAGWTGRDQAALEKHIRELEALGVKRPATTPIFYRVSAARLTTDTAIEAVGTTSSGEVEYALLQHAGRLWVGVGSDHTDREVETYGVTVSKQMCDKPIATTFWPVDEVAGHWDSLILRSYIVENGARVLYQEGALAGMLSPADLIGRYTDGGQLRDGTLMFCGTFAAKGGIRPASRFDYEIVDETLQRTIQSGYDIVTLPILG